MLLLDGLFDSMLDAQLQNLSQHSSKTNILSQSASLRASPSYPPSHTLRYTRYTLQVPHLKVPWANVLVDILWRVLRLRLEPFYADVPPTYSHNPSFYPPLPVRISQSNDKILANVRASSGNILPRIACYVKLCYVNTLCRSLRVERESLENPLCPTPFQPPPHSDLPIPPPRRTRPVIVDAHVVRASDGFVHSYLLGGILVRKSLLVDVADIFKTYNILVRMPPESVQMATLCSLSNSGTALINQKTIRCARGPSLGFIPLQTYVRERLATSWSSLCRHVLVHAAYLSAKRENEHRRAVVSRLAEAALQVASLRQQLVKHALEFEMAGKRLADIAAFAVALHRGNEWEHLLTGFSDEYCKELSIARNRVTLLTAVDSYDVTAMVGLQKEVRR